MPKYDITSQHWHPMVDDEVGGWSVANYNTDSVSKLNPELGHRVVAHCLNERIARMVATQHNETLARQVEASYLNIYDQVRVVLNRNGKTWTAHQFIDKAYPVGAYEQAVDQLANMLKRHITEALHDE